MSKRILIVDDEPDILEILRFNLEMEKYEVQTSETPLAHIDILPDLILLDVMMTSKSGFEWAKELKTDPRTADIPIIFCTAKTAENDLLKGFGLGSDDYICKPFRVSEVKARIAAVLRRTNKQHVYEMNPESFLSNFSGSLQYPDNDGNTIQYEGIVMNFDRKECSVDGKNVSFTKLEFEVLALLLSSPGQVFSREKILRTVWPDHTVVLDRTVDVNITRIRKKIGHYGDYLKTRFGYGYLFEK